MKKLYITLPLGMFSGLVLSTALLASEATGVDFSALDTNQDGTLSAEEASANPGLSQNWSAIDSDENGVIDNAEFSAFEATQEAGSEPMEQK